MSNNMDNNTLNDSIIELKINSEILSSVIFDDDVTTTQNESIKINCPENSVHNNLNSENLLIFGYGSLMWKADFPFVERMGGYIMGYERRFYQNSIDHRGTIEKPGRVVTLIPSSDPSSKVWGIAYKIAPKDREAVLKHLDYREKNGYCRHEAKFYKYVFKQDEVDDPADILLYLATVDNESFNDESDLHKIADQIYYAEGISGTNREYVYKLANALRTCYPGTDENHIFELETILKNRENKFEKIEKSITYEISSSIKYALDNGLTYDNVSHIIHSVTKKFQNGQRDIEN